MKLTRGKEQNLQGCVECRLQCKLWPCREPIVLVIRSRGFDHVEQHVQLPLSVASVIVQSHRVNHILHTDSTIEEEGHVGHAWLNQ
jgi:hypothetical protein